MTPIHTQNRLLNEKYSTVWCWVVKNRKRVSSHVEPGARHEKNEEKEGGTYDQFIFCTLLVVFVETVRI